jgi:hypothetical protein
MSRTMIIITCNFNNNGRRKALSGGQPPILFSPRHFEALKSSIALYILIGLLGKIKDG